MDQKHDFSAFARGRRMPFRVSALVAVLSIAAMEVHTGGQALPPSRRRATAPTFVMADRHDRSRALRDLPVRPPGSGVLHELPRRVRPLGRRSHDPIVQYVPAAPLVPAPSLSFDGLGNVTISRQYAKHPRSLEPLCKQFHLLAPMIDCEPCA